MTHSFECVCFWKRLHVCRSGELGRACDDGVAGSIASGAAEEVAVSAAPALAHESAGNAVAYRDSAVSAMGNPLEGGGETRITSERRGGRGGRGGGNHELNVVASSLRDSMGWARTAHTHTHTHAHSQLRPDGVTLVLDSGVSAEKGEGGEGGRTRVATPPLATHAPGAPPLSSALASPLARRVHPRN